MRNFPFLTRAGFTIPRGIAFWRCGVLVAVHIRMLMPYDNSFSHKPLTAPLYMSLEDIHVAMASFATFKNQVI